MNTATRKTLMSSDQHDWRTPPNFYRRLYDEFFFDLDAAAAADNRLCDRYFSFELNALAQNWDGHAYCNPPYGSVLPQFIRKAFNEVQTGVCPLAVLLVPSRTDTIVWHECVMRATEVRFVRGRIHFLDRDGVETDPAPFPSAVVIMRRDALNRFGGPRFRSMFL